MILLELFFTFFKIGLFTFGGGYAMIPLIEQNVVGNGWLTPIELINFIAISESTPGPFAINISTFIGIKTSGFIGAFCSTLGVVLPSFIVILVVAKFYNKFKKNKYVIACMNGLKPCVIGMIGTSIITMFKTNIFNDFSILSIYSYIPILILIIMLILSIKKVHPIIIICLSSVIGIIVCSVFPVF